MKDRYRVDQTNECFIIVDLEQPIRMTEIQAISGYQPVVVGMSKFMADKICDLLNKGEPSTCFLEK